MANRIIRPRWYLIKLNETKYWQHGDKNIVPLLGRVFGVYIANLSRYVHCCEITPSYELIFVESRFEGIDTQYSDKQLELMDDYIREADSQTDQFRYYHTRAIDRLPKIRLNFMPLKKQSGGKAFLGWMESDINEDDIMERVRANSL